MKLSLTQENLHKALAVVGRVVSNRSSLPVLSNVLLATDKSRLRLSATNLEIGINYWIRCKVDQEGSVTVPSRLFSEFVASLPSDNIELSASETNLNVKTGHYQSQINGIAAEEFPIIPEIKKEPALTVPADRFHEALNQVVGAASLDEARPVLAGVHIVTDEKKLVMVATDSYRLAERQIELDSEPGHKISIIVPTRTMQELVRILADQTGDLALYLADNQIMFELDGIELTSRLIDGQFPNYKQIIPKETETEVLIETSEFARLTKVASLFARESAGSIRIDVRAEGDLSIVSSAAEVGENTSNTECEVNGEDGEISLNARYLSEALAVLKTTKVLFCMSGKLNPCVLRPVNDEPDETFLYIIMPLRT